MRGAAVRRIERRPGELCKGVVLDPGPGGPISRRAFLGGGAALAVATALDAAPPALARPTADHFVVPLERARFRRDGRRLVSEPIRAPGAFSVVGLRRGAGPAGRAELRVRRRGGAWSAWAAAGGGEPVFVVRADELQVRLDQRPDALAAACVAATPEQPL